MRIEFSEGFSVPKGELDHWKKHEANVPRRYQNASHMLTSPRAQFMGVIDNPFYRPDNSGCVCCDAIAYLGTAAADTGSFDRVLNWYGA